MVTGGAGRRRRSTAVRPHWRPGRPAARCPPARAEETREGGGEGRGVVHRPVPQHDRVDRRPGRRVPGLAGPLRQRGIQRGVGFVMIDGDQPRADQQQPRQPLRVGRPGRPPRTWSQAPRRPSGRAGPSAPAPGAHAAPPRPRRGDRRAALPDRRDRLSSRCLADRARSASGAGSARRGPRGRRRLWPARQAAASGAPSPSSR